MYSLKDKTIIVTGASRGIGRALAVGLTKRGARLVLGARSARVLADTAELCAEAGHRAQFVPGNVGDSAIAAALATKAMSTGRLDGFIHAAGVLHPGPLVWELRSRQFHDIFTACVDGAYQLAAHTYPAMRERGRGFAVFFGSGAADRPQKGIGAYCAAKAAEEHLARQLANEAPEIAAFIYRPGVVETHMQEQARQCEGGGAEAVRSIFRKWKEDGLLLTPEESAEGLIRLITQGPGEHHGKTRDIRDM